jgi:hypothetical protein
MEPGDGVLAPEALVKRKPAAKSKAQRGKAAKAQSQSHQEAQSQRDDFVLDALSLAEDMPCAFGMGSHVPAFFLVSARSN